MAKSFYGTLPFSVIMIFTSNESFAFSPIAVCFVLHLIKPSVAAIAFALF
jgi:hypothetical protein